VAKPTKKRQIEAAQLLEEALALMNDKGAHWRQGSYRWTDRRTGEVSFCSVGAIREVSKGRSALRSLMQEALAREVPASSRWLGASPRHKIEFWNDDRERSWKDISKVFKTAARRLRKEA
jgi:hypothetical protein